ncbi:MAG: 50S ribosomal protein L17 [bacterium]
MRHRKHRSKLNRTTEHRTALMRNLAAALVEHERIETTFAKARQLRSFVEKLITLGKKGSLADRRLCFSYLGKKEGVHKIFTVLAPRYEKRQGGYLRMTKLGPRYGDGALVAAIEFVDRVIEAPKPKKTEREKRIAKVKKRLGMGA